MSEMLSVDDISRRHSSSHSDTAGYSASQAWNPSKFSNGPPEMGGDKTQKSLNQPRLSVDAYTSSSSSPQFPGHNEIQRTNSCQPKDASPGYSNAYMFNTGESLGTLSGHMATVAKTKLTPSREQMKDKLVNALASDTNVGILPGYKTNGFTGGGFHGLRTSQSATLYGNGGFQPESPAVAPRLPSPVARAQAAIGKTRQEIRVAEDIIQGNNNRISGIYRHPAGEKWLNASTPGTGCDSASVRRLKQDRYRRDLETQMEQSRLRKAVELQKDREGMEHPLGTGYNSHSIYTLSMHEPKDVVGKTSHTPKYTEPTLKSCLKSNAKPTATPNPWLDRQPTTTSTQAPQQFKPVANSTPHQLAPVTNPSPHHQGQQPYGPIPYPPQQQIPTLPYMYPYAPQPPNQMPPPQPQFQMYPQPIQMQMQPLQYQQQGVMPPQHYVLPPPLPQNPTRTNFAKGSTSVSPRANTNFDLLLQEERLQFKGNSKEESPSWTKSMPETHLTDDDMDETAIRQHVWQTSDQLASDDFKKTVYQAMLKKQIIQKQRQTEVERVKEAEDNEKLDRSIEEYQEKMRKQMEDEQNFIRRKQGVNTLDELNWPTDVLPTKIRPYRILSDWNIVPVPKVKVSNHDFDEKPIKTVKGSTRIWEKDAGDSGIQEKVNQDDHTRTTPQFLNVEVVVQNPIQAIESGCGDTTMTDGASTTIPNEIDSKQEHPAENRIKILSQIKSALEFETKRMEFVMTNGESEE